jgi:gluconokinase
MAVKKNDEWYIGVDLGTGSCKSIITDARAQVLGFGVSDYSAIGVQAKWKEQNPEALVDAMIQSVRAAIHQANVLPQACQGMSIGGALHSLIAIDRTGKPLTGVLTWVDDRAVQQAAVVRGSVDAKRIYQQTGCPVHSNFPLYKLIWLREKQPDIFDKAVRFVSAKEYVTERLTGQWIVDFNIASGSGLLNIHDLSWNAKALQLAGVTSSQLSSLSSPWTVIRELNTKLASEMGISANTPLVLGSSDAANSSIGAGAVLPECATCMIGTSGAFRIIAKQALLDPSARSWCYAIDEKHWLVGGAINNGGIVLSWLRDLLNQAISPASEKEQLSFDDLITMAQGVKAGADGLICLPFFAGERSPNWNMNTRGVFFGLTLKHNANHIARALLEGVAFRLRTLKEVLNEMGCEINEIRASGGLTHSELWPQIIASALKVELRSPQWGETSSLGTALWALLGTGDIHNLEDIRGLIPLTRSYRPAKKDSERYDQLFQIYQDLYLAMEKSFKQIADISVKK